MPAAGGFHNTGIAAGISKGHVVTRFTGADGLNKKNLKPKHRKWQVAMLRCWLLDAAEAATTQFLLDGERGFPTLYSLLLGRRLSLSLAPARAKRALAPPPPLSTLFPFDSVHARSDSVVSPEFPLVSPPGARRGGHACARRLQGQGARPARPAIARGPAAQQNADSVSLRQRVRVGARARH